MGRLRSYSPLPLILATTLLLWSAASAFDITHLLDQKSDFSTFNKLLSQTGLASEINNRMTITVLVVSNGAMGAMSGKSQTVAKNILATHVILDYYDDTKLKGLSDNSTRLTTLFQATGQADRDMGFLNVTKTGGGSFVFGSAVKNAQHDAQLVGVVAAQPYNISVLQVSQLINTPGIDQTGAPPPKSQGPTHSPKASPPAGPTPFSPSHAPDSHEAPPSSDSPSSDSPSSDSNSPSSDSDSPSSDSPAASDSPPADHDNQSAASKTVVGGSAALVAAALVAF